MVVEAPIKLDGEVVIITRRRINGKNLYLQDGVIRMIFYGIEEGIMLFVEVSNDKGSYWFNRDELENKSLIYNDIADELILQSQINYALDTGNKDLFLHATDELNILRQITVLQPDIYEMRGVTR